MKVLEVALNEFADKDCFDLSKEFRRDEAVVCLVHHRELPATTLLFCSPRDSFWCFFNPDVAQNSRWRMAIESEAIDGRGMVSELKRWGIKKRSLPYLLVPIRGSENYSHPRNALNPWFRSAIVPSKVVDELVRYSERWLSEFNSVAHWPFPDRHLGETFPTSDSPDAELFHADPMTIVEIEKWVGKPGLLARLISAVEGLERGEKDCVNLTAIDRAMPHFELPDRTWWFDGSMFAHFNERARLVDSGYRGLNIHSIDLIVSYRCRLARLLGWPQLYWDCERQLSKLQRCSESIPWSDGIPYQPADELIGYLSEQRSLHPILVEQPFDIAVLN